METARGADKDYIRGVVTGLDRRTAYVEECGRAVYHRQKNVERDMDTSFRQHSRAHRDINVAFSWLRREINNIGGHADDIDKLYYDIECIKKRCLDVADLGEDVDFLEDRVITVERKIASDAIIRDEQMKQLSIKVDSVMLRLKGDSKRKKRKLEDTLGDTN